jgi:hypothetical protein
MLKERLVSILSLGSTAQGGENFVILSLQDTDIGRHVNGLRKHPSSEVRQLVKLLVR